jgi:chromosome segregation ATPase
MDVKKNNDELIKNFEDISVKVNDFDIYELFKNNTVEGGSIDTSAILIQNLEKKLFKKFELIDTNLKKQNEDVFRTKNEMGNVKQNMETNNKSLNSMKEDIEKIKKSSEEIRGIIDDKIADIEDKLRDLSMQINDSIMNQLSDMREKHKEDMNKLIEETKSNYNYTMQEEEKNKNQPSSMTDSDLRVVRECIKKTSDFEKTFKVFVANVNIENVKSELSKIKEALESKLNITDVNDFKENMCKKFIFIFK